MEKVDKSVVNRSFSATVEHYQQLRRIAYQITEKNFHALGVKLQEISYGNAVEGDQWSKKWAAHEKQASWSWVAAYDNYQAKNACKRFDAALFSGGCLCALCYGVPTKKKLSLKIHLLARNPLDNPLSGHTLTIILFAAFAYARLLGCKEVLLCEPMNERLAGKYQERGFSPHRNRMGVVTYLSARLSYD
ncbi:hypothetical protein V8J88_01000 [Massilia sp. W12]|uniref:hypothetical protein n=1 Tax=Massilia sp. W12 TaxID=3126507 RepID=UPI0030CDB46B